MIALGIDTSGILGGVALAREGRLLAETRSDARAAASERILPQIDRLLADLGLARRAIERVGVVLGPGSFTGVRVGLATAKGLALGLEVPVVGFSTIAARTFALGAAGRAVMVLTAYRRGEVFCGAGYHAPEGFQWLLGAASRPVGETAAWLKAALQAARREGKLPLLCAGDGVAGVLEQAVAAVTADPDAVWLPGALLGAVPGAAALLAAQAPAAELVEGAAIDALEPAYLRGADTRRPGGQREGGG
ncbi:MAG: tRNA (adenosine(37)-N6)-threonylcarbamoyltransferase complex dimerization subunit type 1 TsaB [Candidatus Eisenbacteria sp.]|nr:tRNA (adenosine(37)-N6)-threonylcarbamoyltransferase complex dimerization subunit type 1 TsaB [Candidatus Eisenbacteria bacterium]